MSKPFDLEAAKRGEEIEFSPIKGSWVDVHFIGTTREGECVVECATYYGNLPFIIGEEWLRMKSKKRTVWVNLYPEGNCYYHSTEQLANEARDETTRISNRAWPLEIEE